MAGGSWRQRVGFWLVTVGVLVAGVWVAGFGLFQGPYAVSMAEPGTLTVQHCKDRTYHTRHGWHEASVCRGTFRAEGGSAARPSATVTFDGTFYFRGEKADVYRISGHDYVDGRTKRFASGLAYFFAGLLVFLVGLIRAVTREPCVYLFMGEPSSARRRKASTWGLLGCAVCMVISGFVWMVAPA